MRGLRNPTLPRIFPTTLCALPAHDLACSSLLLNGIAHAVAMSVQPTI